MARLAGFLLTVMALLWAPSAFAHPLAGSAVFLDFHHNGIGAELQLPMDQLELGFKQPLMDDPRLAVTTRRAALTAYILDHIHPLAPDGQAWTVKVEDMRVLPAGDYLHPVTLDVQLWMAPPQAAPLEQLTLNYDVMTHELMTHTVLVYARSDWNNAVFSNNPELLGTIRWVVKSVDIDRSRGSFWKGMASIFKLGMSHIAEGTDHLLFLLALLLPAPLLAAGGRWGDYGGVRYTFRRLFKIVTAFTLGHSFTLILGAFAGLIAPQKPVEILIAVSIFFSAMHAWRPLFKGHETWIAAAFGLIHGMSFAAVVAAGGMDAWHKAGAILGFNLGIEAMQVIVVCLVVPWFILLARARTYTALRISGAMLAAAASIGWVVERISGHDNLLSRPVTGTLAHAGWGIAALAIAAAVITLRRRDRLTTVAAVEP